MNLLEAMEQRHAIRAYTDEPVDQAILDILRAEIDACNQESGLHIQMAAGLDDAFLGLKTHYGRFTGVHNAIALIGRAERGGAADDAMVDAGGHDTATEPAAGVAESGSAAAATPNNAATAAWHKSTAVDEAATDPSEIALQERVGYYGERVALRAVQLGLETSWAVLDDADTAEHPWWCLYPGEKIVVLAFGHGARPGGRRRSKPIEELCRIPDGMAMPDWFRAGMEAAMLAPTSLSQQPFLFTLHEDGTVSVEATEGLFAYVGLGCAKYHFEVGAERENVRWRDTAASGEEAAGATD